MQDRDEDENGERPFDEIAQAAELDEAFAVVIRRMMLANDPEVIATMKRFTAAAALLIAGKRGRDMTAPEPLMQTGFEPDEEEMQLLVATAQRDGRDLIHIGCHEDGSGLPVGLIAVVYFENGVARPHRRCGLLRGPGGGRVYLSGVSDMEDEPCHFVLRPGRKMIRVAGYPVEFSSAALKRAGHRWQRLALSQELDDCGDELLTVYTSIQATPEEAERFASDETIH